ncbi:hypothetical protein B0J14DRAFT_659836 [Halenospora varia]|nr:hypothetical protein B0J14DRAFT_659836 [Halenospora varia]
MPFFAFRKPIIHQDHHHWDEHSSSANCTIFTHTTKSTHDSEILQTWSRKYHKFKKSQKGSVTTAHSDGKGKVIILVHHDQGRFDIPVDEWSREMGDERSREESKDKLRLEKRDESLLRAKKKLEACGQSTGGEQAQHHAYKYPEGSVDDLSEKLETPASDHISRSTSTTHTSKDSNYRNKRAVHPRSCREELHKSWKEIYGEEWGEPWMAELGHLPTVEEAYAARRADALKEREDLKREEEEKERINERKDKGNEVGEEPRKEEV